MACPNATPMGRGLLFSNLRLLDIQHRYLDVTMANSGYTVLAMSVGGHVTSESKPWRVRDKKAIGFNLSNNSNSQGEVVFAVFGQLA